MGNTPPVKARAACRGFIEITNTQTKEVYLLNVHKIIQVTKSEQFVKIYVSGGQEGSLTYEIHKDCYKQLLESIQDAQGPASFVEDNLNR